MATASTTQPAGDPVGTTARRPRRSVRWAALLCPFVVLAVVDVAGWTLGADWRRNYDVDIYLEATSRFLHGQDPYAYATARDLGFTYPPAALFLFAPLALLPKALALVTWHLVLLGSVLAATAWVARRFFPLTTPLVLLLAGLVVVATDPVSDSLHLGQLSPLVGIAGLAVVLGPPRTGAFLGGVGAALKLTPAGMVLGLLGGPQRTERVLRAVLAGLTVTALAALAAPHLSVRYWTSLVWDSGRVGGLGSGSNVSLTGLFAHLGLADRPAQVAGVAGSLLLAGLWLWRGRGARLHPLARATGAGVLVVLLVPVSWSHHALAMTLGLAVLALDRRWLPAALGALAWTLPLFEWAAELAAPWGPALQLVRPLSLVAMLWWTTRPGFACSATAGRPTTA